MVKSPIIGLTVSRNVTLTLTLTLNYQSHAVLHFLRERFKIQLGQDSGHLFGSCKKNKGNWDGTSRGIRSAAYVSSLRLATTSGGRP
jgi:hypothetical protein